MKERIVIEVNAQDVSDYNDNRAIIFSKDEGKSKVEQVPTNWAELKELCKDIKEVKITEEGYINVDFVYFTKDGLIYTYVEGVLMSSLSLPVSKNRTPQQMWQIIKSLIGEE